jgi:hypothetical protein
MSCVTAGTSSRDCVVMIQFVLWLRQMFYYAVFCFEMPRISGNVVRRKCLERVLIAPSYLGGPGLSPGPETGDFPSSP